MALARNIRLWQYAERVVLEPLSGSLDYCISINKSTGAFDATGEPSLKGCIEKPYSIALVIGTIDLLAGTYLAIATDSQRVGCLRGSHVFQITSTCLIPCFHPSAAARLSKQQKSDEAEYVGRVRNALSSHGLFYSFGTNLTMSLQRQSALSQQELEVPLWKRADSDFVWNKFLLQRISTCPEASPFTVPVFQGSFQSLQSEVNGRHVDVTLIARRAIDRIGTRMWRRGADSSGFVANSVETEQIVCIDGKLSAAYVQVRGSIPVFWEQIVDLTYKPKIRSTANEASRGAMDTPLRMHVKRLEQKYGGQVVALDLVNQKGGELVVGSAFASAAEELAADKAGSSSLRYVPFDFHKICGHSHFDRLSLLYNQVQNVLEEQAYFISKEAEGAASSSIVLKTQSGVARTNCIDCLDRTNVTQSLLGRLALERQLRDPLLSTSSSESSSPSSVFGSEEAVHDHAELDRKLKIAWANHGDDISRQYSGTNALKGDFVRFGKRSAQGFLQDGQSAILRYVFNNFSDGVRQDGLDLLMGRFLPSPSSPSPFLRSGPEKYTRFLPAVALLLACAYFAAKSAVKGLMVGSSSDLVATVLWVSISGFILFTFKKFGRLYCDKPRLCKLR